MALYHECPGGCGDQVTRTLLACREDWHRLPQALRFAIQETYRGGVAQFAAHRQAVDAAVDWYNDNPRGAS